MMSDAVVRVVPSRAATAQSVSLILPVILPVMAAVLVAPVIPDISRAFAADPNAGLLVPVAITIPALMLALFSPLAGWLADQFGRRRLFVAGMVVFTVASALCAASPTIGTLIAARAIQGAGAGMLAPLGFAMAVLVFPPQRRGFALSLIAGAALVANASGPLLGGALIELVGWPAIFLVNVPVGVVTILLARRWWPETVDARAAGQKVAGGVVALVPAVGHRQHRHAHGDQGQAFVDPPAGREKGCVHGRAPGRNTRSM